MQTHRFVALVLSFLVIPQLHATKVEPASLSVSVTLGKLDRFWRNSAVLGPFLESGYALETVPNYMLQGDFPYPKRKQDKEVLFADHLSIVRLLGGYNDHSDKGPGDSAVRARDLAYRDANGKIAYRMELLRLRLKPWLDAGYDSLTIVLDNVPWCFPATPGIRDVYGQGVPPSDPSEWGEFVRVLCRELIAIMGQEKANSLRFRVGTENNGPKRFDGTTEQYWKHYEAAARAVQEVLPGAKFGAFNISGISVRNVANANVNAYTIAERSAAAGLRFDWVAYSRYFRVGEDPDLHARVCREVWQEFEHRVPALKGFSREIHEFGIAPWGEVASGVFPSAEPGANGAALTAHMMWRLRTAGINRLWHWPMGERIRTGENSAEILPIGSAWVMSVMEFMAGGETSLFEPLTVPADATKVLAVTSTFQERSLLMIAAYHLDASHHDLTKVTFRIPGRLLSAGSSSVAPKVLATWLTTDTAPFDAIRRDLLTGGQLPSDFVQRPDRVGSFKQMALQPAAAKLVDEHIKKYQQMWVDSLTLKPLNAAMAKVERDPQGDFTITVNLAPPAILVLEMR